MLTWPRDSPAQIDELQKKYRIVDGDRKAFSQEGQQALLRQRANIDKLKGDNQQLKEELQLEKKHSKAHQNVSAQAQISKLQDTGDVYTRKIELEKRRIEELDKQMDVMHKKIWEQREKMGGINASRENNQAIAKQACGLPRTDAPQSPSARALPRPLSARALSCRG